MTSWNTEEILDLLQECGRIALSFYEDPDISIKDDLTLVTQADHAVEARLAETLDRPEEQSFLIGEETSALKSPDYVRRAFEHTAWIVDPIDGTVPYAHHLSHWGISIGLMEQGHLTEGAIYLPVTREYYVSDKGGLFYANPAPGEAPQLKPLSVVRCPSGERSIIGISQDVVRGKLGRLANPVQTLGCVVVPFAYMLQGRFMGYVGSMKLWDIAGSVPLLRNAGFILRSADGSTIDAEISPRQFVLDADDNRAFYMLSNVVAAPSEEVYEYIRSRVELPDTLI